MGRLHYRKDTDLPWRRVKNGTGFRFVKENGKTVTGTERQRVLKLAIPPAWTEVVVSADPWDYIQAVGVDAKGRKQYIYHPEWVKKSQEKKFDQMVLFGERLPTLRAVIREHMGERGLTKNRILATVVWLLEHTFIRVGNKEYATQNQSYGLTTLRGKHVDVRGDTVTFSFEGKSGVFHELDVTHPKVAKTIKKCLELPGYVLFQYLDADGEHRTVDAQEVNDYLRAYAGDFSAKDFRTWGGSVLAGDSLYQKGRPKDSQGLKANISEAVTRVAEHLGNTAKVCRTYYIHPVIIESYEKDILVPHFARSYGRKSAKRLALTREEYATWSLIKDS